MRIGIITFHWATNYGAVLQCYALQETLNSMGHDVFVINYKPSKYDYNPWTFFRMKKFKEMKKFKHDLQKEREIETFRVKFLKRTNRFYTQKQLLKSCSNFDAIISGSDQVLNESFLRGGENGGSTAYYLDFGCDSTLRIFYAVSFGATKFPADLVEKVAPIVQRLNSVSCRENSGLEIFREMGINNGVLVPDPTLLLNRTDYEKLLPATIKTDKPFVYLLHGRYSFMQNKLPSNATISTSEGIEQWLLNIRKANVVITNSFHCAVFCIQFHIPFFVVLQTLENVGMNDRFYTMLSKLGLAKRMVLETEFQCTLNDDIDWNYVDSQLSEYRQIGINFLNETLNI